MSSVIVIAVVVITFFGVAYGLYSRKGSGIEAHPMGSEHGGGGAPGVDRPTADDEYEGQADSGRS